MEKYFVLSASPDDHGGFSVLLKTYRLLGRDRHPLSTVRITLSPTDFDGSEMSARACWLMLTREVIDKLSERKPPPEDLPE